MSPLTNDVVVVDNFVDWSLTVANDFSRGDHTKCRRIEQRVKAVKFEKIK